MKKRLQLIGVMGIVFVFALCSSVLAACPPGYPIDCNNGWCCPQDYPVCHYGSDEGTCSRCASEVALDNDEAKLTILRTFRDEILSQTPEGQMLIQLYYEMSPAIVQAMEEDEAFKAEVKGMIEGVLPLIGKEAE